MRRVFVDTGGFYALADADDAHHVEAVAVQRRLAEERVPALTTDFVVAETHALVLCRLGAGVARSWLARLTVPREPVGEADWEEAVGIVRDRDAEGYTLTDALSFVVMRRTGIREAFAFDRHFRRFGFVALTA